MWLNNPCVSSGSSSELMDRDTSVCDAAELGAKWWLPLPAEAPAPDLRSTSPPAKLLPAAGLTPASWTAPVWVVFARPGEVGKLELDGRVPASDSRLDRSGSGLL
jgi:hypothetical protein